MTEDQVNRGYKLIRRIDHLQAVINNPESGSLPFSNGHVFQSGDFTMVSDDVYKELTEAMTKSMVNHMSAELAALKRELEAL